MNSILENGAARALKVVPQGDLEIVMTRSFGAPRELVWEVLSRPEHIRRWYGPRSETMTVCEIDFRVGGKWRFVLEGANGGCAFRGEFRELIRPEKIVQTSEFEEMPGHISLETMTLEERDGRTTLTALCQFDSQQDRDAMLYSGMEEGAGESYDRMEELLEKLKNPGETASHSSRGSRALSDADVFLTRVFDAPRELVWAAFTQAEHLAKWWGPKGCSTRVLQLDLRPGGLYHYAMDTPGGTMYGRFIYRDVVAPERLAFVLSFADENANVVRAPFSTTWPLELLCENVFEDENGKTRVTMASAPLDASDEERSSFEQGRAGLKAGTNASLDALDEFLRELQA